MWAFGVVLWEIATYGKTPYPGVDLFSVLDKIEAGYRMPRPEGCPAEVYALMRDCWQYKPDMRPDFKVIKARLENLYSNSNIQDEVQKVLTIEKGMKLEEIDESSFDAPKLAPKKPPLAQPPLPQRSPSVVATSSSSLATSAAKPPVPKPRPATKADNGGPRDLSEDMKEVIEMTKGIFRQAQQIIRHTPIEALGDSITLLVTDTEQMISACR